MSPDADAANPLLLGSTISRRSRWMNTLKVSLAMASVGALVLIATPAGPKHESHEKSAVVSVVAKPTACSAYTACAALAGDCCPVAGGANLDCCNSGLSGAAPAQASGPAPAPEQTPKGSADPAPAPAPDVTLKLGAASSCAANADCSKYDGDCCPDDHGYTMACCTPPVPTPAPTVVHATGPVITSDDPVWGCGLLGAIPGISADGSASPGTKELLDSIKQSSTFKKVSYWNYKFAPDASQILGEDFIFMPENWGMGAALAQSVENAGINPAYLPEIANILLGTNEPDITGSCMGDMFGVCQANCPPAGPQVPPACPVASLTSKTPAKANDLGQCNCWQGSHATGAGFWSLPPCTAPQPLPVLWNGQDQNCVNTVMNDWKQSAATATSKGYKWLTTPMIAQNMSWGRTFLEHACGCTTPSDCTCKEASCGCPQYFAFHYYAYDCQPDLPSGYAAFQEKIDFVKNLMEEYSFVKGAIVNEVGLLNCKDQAHGDPICSPDTGTNPGSSLPDHACPNTPQVIEHLLDQVVNTKTKDGRGVVKGFTWFNENMDGGTYNLQLFNPDGSTNEAGKAYMRGCEKWAADSKK